MLETDAEIARGYTLEPIGKIAGKCRIAPTELEYYGNYKAKVVLKAEGRKAGRLVLVTAITPTSAGEGKTTVSIGLADALAAKGQNVALALREPSLGPVFGLKGGATGGGHAQVAPMEEINLHFTGDFAAVEAANNLIAAMLDNSLMRGNPLRIDQSRITWKRCLDVNDRQLRFIVSGLGGRSNGRPREDGFEITAASEIMAILCLAEDLDDLKRRLSSLILARDLDGNPVTLADLNGVGAAAALLKDALKPNIVQTLRGTPAFVHGGPFANIAHGCNSIIATRMALSHSDITVTEAGFGADLGAEKFIDIKCRQLGKLPDAAVLVVTERALKLHGGADKEKLKEENKEALEKGIANLMRHISNLKELWHLPLVVAINPFPGDSDKDYRTIKEAVSQAGVPCQVAEVWAKGAEGGEALADEVLKLLEMKSEAEFTYDVEDSLADKIRKVATRVYRADGVIFSPGVLTKLRRAEADGFSHFPVCIAKTQYSFSDDPRKLGAPEDFKIKIRDVKVAAGAGFVIAYSGDIITMPGLPEVPAATGIDVDEEGYITGLF